MSQSENLNELFTALAKASAEFKVAVFDKKANYGPYASFKSVREASVASLSKHGLSVTQPVSFDGSFYVIDTIVGHSSGQYMRSTIRLILDRNNMQGLGSAITYAKRYAWAAVLGIVSDDDDDGYTASAPAPVSPPRQSPKAAPVKPKMAKLDRNNSPASQNLIQDVFSLAMDRGVQESELKALVWNGYECKEPKPATWILEEIAQMLSEPDCTSATVLAKMVTMQNEREALRLAKEGAKNG